MIIFRPALKPTLFVICATILCVYLALWQKDRAVWKENLLSNMTQKWREQPSLLPIISLRLKGDKDAVMGNKNTLNLMQRDELSLVTVTGKFLSYPLFYRTANHAQFGQGYEVIAPFRASEGVIPVVMGIIPADKKQSYLPPDNPMTLIGALRLPETDNGSDVRPRDLVAQVPFNFYYKIFKSELLPNYITATQHNHFGAFPVPKNTGEFLENIPNNHITYMWTWLFLAGTLWVVYIVWHYQNSRLKIRD